MPASKRKSLRERADLIERYAKGIFRAAKAEGHLIGSLDELRHAAQFAPELADVIAEMSQERDVDLFSEVNRRVEELVNEDGETVAITVTTAAPMDDDLRAKVIAKAETLYGTDVLIQEVVDPSIEGGIIIEGAGQRFDVSVRSQLMRYKSLLTATYRGGGE